MPELAIESLTARGFRNLEPLEVDLGPRFNVFAGANGQGKTNLLEAVYVVATSRSFRTSRLPDLVAHGAPGASILAVLVEDGDRREQSVGLRPGVRAVRIDGKRPPSLAAYAVSTPVVVFHPGSVSLSSGAGSERRKLLDRLALFRSPASLGDADAYARAVRARQRVLETRGEATRDLEHWEELVVRHGLALQAARQDASAELCPEAVRAFAAIGAAGSVLSLRYAPGGPTTSEAFTEALRRMRVRDRARGSASVGPHRDDVIVELDGKPVRGIASQGQHRAVVLALQLAEIALLRAARGVKPILLLDDVSSELDRERTGALLRAVSEQARQGGQVLLTTTRPELIEVPLELPSGSRVDFEVVSGRIRRVG